MHYALVNLTHNPFQRIRVQTMTLMVVRYEPRSTSLCPLIFLLGLCLTLSVELLIVILTPSQENDESDADDGMLCECPSCTLNATYAWPLRYAASDDQI